MESRLEIHLNRKFTRHDLSAYGQPNPNADAMLIAMLADGNDNGASTEGKDSPEGYSLVCVRGIAQSEVGLSLCHYIASKGDGCEVYAADCCRAMIEILNDADTVPNVLPGYALKDDGSDWTWGEWLARDTVAATERDGRRFIGAGTFDNRSTQLTATEHLALTQAGLTLTHPDNLPEPAPEV